MLQDSSQQETTPLHKNEQISYESFLQNPTGTAQAKELNGIEFKLQTMLTPANIEQAKKPDNTEPKLQTTPEEAKEEQNVDFKSVKRAKSVNGKALQKCNYCSASLSKTNMARHKKNLHNVGCRTTQDNVSNQMDVFEKNDIVSLSDSSSKVIKKAETNQTKDSIASSFMIKLSDEKTMQFALETGSINLLDSGVINALITNRNKMPDLANALKNMQFMLGMSVTAIAGIMMAMFIFESSICQIHTALQALNPEIRRQAVKVWQNNLQYIFQNQSTCKWLSENIQSLEPNHFVLASSLEALDKSHEVLQVTRICSPPEDTEMFIHYSLLFIGFQGRLFQQSIQKSPRQTKLSFKEFLELVRTVNAYKNAQLIEKNSEKLAFATIDQWKNIIEQLNESYQQNADEKSMDEVLEILEVSFGSVNSSRLNSIKQSLQYTQTLKNIANPPNEYQKAIATYIAAKLQENNKQLWTVAGGAGKSRIIATVALILKAVFKLSVGIITTKNLVQRDTEEYAEYFELLIGTQSIKYYGEIIDATHDVFLVDEADYFLLSNPSLANKRFANKKVVCITATSAETYTDQNEESVYKQLGFQMFHYNIENLQPLTVNFDEVIQKSDLDSFIQNALKTYSVILYCDEDIQLTNDHFYATIETEPSLLRKLGEPNKVVCVTDPMMMRGVDYRQTSGLCLIIAKSFATNRDRDQGLMRVGRYGDRCQRVRLQCTDLVDKKTSNAQKKLLIRFLENVKEIKHCQRNRDLKADEKTENKIEAQSKLQFPMSSRTTAMVKRQ